MPGLAREIEDVVRAEMPLESVKWMPGGCLVASTVGRPASREAAMDTGVLFVPHTACTEGNWSALAQLPCVRPDVSDTLSFNHRHPGPPRRPELSPAAIPLLRKEGRACTASECVVILFYELGDMSSG